MINSMTGSAHQQLQHMLGNFSCEIRSVNQRYLEFSVRLPDNLRELESPIRELARQQLQRGKVECFIRQQVSEAAAQNLHVNPLAVRHLAQAIQVVETEMYRDLSLNGLEILQWPGILTQDAMNGEELKEVVLNLFTATLKELQTVRQREGIELQKILLQRLTSIGAEVVKISAHAGELVQIQRERLQAKVAELIVNVDPQRLEQEIVLLAQKADVMEELDRLTAHIAEVKRILQQGGAVGRRLDFLIQELHREANTLASKSTDTSVTQSTVEIRVLIDQMREQVQNLE